MQQKPDFEVAIIGAGLAGLTAARHLGKHGISVVVVEPQPFPHHKVCGEYISNEVLPYLNELGIDPFNNGAVSINTLKISDHSGKQITSTLPLGGFGISRYQLDYLMFKSLSKTVEFIEDWVIHVKRNDTHYTIETKNSGSITSSIVLGAYGKRSKLDKTLNRKFILKQSPWLAVKAHYRFDHDPSVVSLHNFEGGYCGISKVENNLVNACYLVSYKEFKKVGSIDRFQQSTMSKNPFLKQFFEEAEMVFERALSISQISFANKQAVHQGIIMIGDSAGLIHPLCGNGMSMAIHSAKQISELIIENNNNLESPEIIAQEYSRFWNETFKDRLLAGRRIQKILLNPMATRMGFTIAKTFPGIISSVIKRTHGKELSV